jgi:hypothetical protein
MPSSRIRLSFEREDFDLEGIAQLLTLLDDLYADAVRLVAAERFGSYGLTLKGPGQPGVPGQLAVGDPRRPPQ